MRIIKSMRTGVLHRTFTYRQQYILSTAVFWGFRLDGGKNVIEPHVWEAIGESMAVGHPLDQALPKAHGEFLVAGSFHAPQARPVTRGTVAVSLGTMEKSLEVIGDRYWRLAGASKPEPFTEMPVIYERAFGGEGFARNSSGRGFRSLEKDGVTVHPLPNVEYPGQLVTSSGDRPEPAAFDRVDPMWEQRFQFAGTYGESYLRDAFPGFPKDLDWRYFNDAARDQWFNKPLEGGEPFEIINMHPECARIRGNLPRIRPRCFVEQQGQTASTAAEIHEIALQADTVWFFPGQMTGVVIYRGGMAVGEDDGSDILTMLAAAENLDDHPRSRDYYHDQLRKRADPDTGYRYLLQMGPLLPEGCADEFSEMMATEGDPGSSVSDNMESFVQRKQDELHQGLETDADRIGGELEKHGFSADEADRLRLGNLDEAAPEPSPEEDRIKELLDKALPGLRQGDTNASPGDQLADMDPNAFDEISQYIETLEQQQQDKMQDDLRDTRSQLEKELECAPDEPSRQSIREAMASIERAISLQPDTPELPRAAEQVVAAFESQQEALKSQRARLLSMKSQESVPGEKLEEGLNEIDAALSALEGALLDQREPLFEQHRETAHYMEEALSPHPGEEEKIRDALVSAYQTGLPTSEGDYAYVDLSGRDLRNIDLSNAYLEYADLSGCDLSGANLSGAVLSHARLNGTRLSHANLQRVNLGRCHMEAAVFENCNLTEAILSFARIERSSFHNCDLSQGGLSFYQTQIVDSEFHKVNLNGHSFIECGLTGCQFMECHLDDTIFITPDLTSSRFNQCSAARASFITATAPDLAFTQSHLENARFMADCRLERADFSDSMMDDSTFRDAMLVGACLHSASFHRSDFSNADARGACFDLSRGRESLWYKAELKDATLRAADLMDASFRQARAQRADFSDANLYAANFMGITVFDTRFKGCILTNTILEKAGTAE